MLHGRIPALIAVLAFAACRGTHVVQSRPLAPFPCAAGDSENTPLFCGARLDAPLRVLCTLPGRTLRSGSLADTELGVRLADSSLLMASATSDSLDFTRMMFGDEPRTEPCDRAVRRMSREWRTSDSVQALARLASVIARLDSLHEAPVRVYCGVFRREGSTPLVRREARGGGRMSVVDVQRYRSSEAQEALTIADEDAYLRHLKVVLATAPPTPARDTGLQRSRTWMEARLYPDSPRRPRGMSPGFEVVDSSARACSRLLRTGR